MNKKGPREVVFVCVEHSQQITKIISASSPKEASELFIKEFIVSPKEILGPFFKKRTKVIETTRELKFTNQTRKAIYNDWLVNAFLLKEPVDQAYLVFLKRTDDKKVPIPKGTITVPISDLRFI